MWSLLTALMLSQTAAPVKLVDKTDQSKAATLTTTGAKNALDVNCVSGCSGGSGGGGGTSGGSSIVWVDGGRLTADEGVGPDGGVFAVYVVNPSSGGSGSSYVNALIDGGFVTAQIVQSVQLAVGFDGGAVTAFQGGTWSGVGVTGPLTDAQLRASRVPVFLELDAGFVSVANFPVTQAISAAALPLPAGAATEATLLTRTKPADQQHAIIDSSATIATTLSGQPAVFVGFDGGFVSVMGTVSVTGPLTDTQLRATPVPISGSVTATVASTTITGQPAVFIGFDAGFVSIANFPATQTITGNVTANAGTNLNTSALALDATLTGRTQKAQITDGTRDGTVKAASTAAQAADTSLVVGLSPNSALPTGANVIGHVIADTGSTTAVTGTVAVSGPLTDTQLRATPVPVSLATLPALTAGSAVIGHVIADTGSTTAVTQATGTNLHAVLDATSTTTVTQATGTNLHTVVDSAPTTAVTNAGLTNLDVALSTRTKPADQQHTIIDSSASIAVTGPVTDTQLRASPVPVSLTSTTVTGTVAATQSTSPWVDNVSQFGGTNISTGTGTGGAGIPRVTVSSDSTVGLTAGAAVIGSLTANQSVNVAQMNGVATSMGNGAAGTGTQRVVLPGVATSVNIPAAQTPVLVGGSDDNGQAQFIKVDTTGHAYTIPLGNQQYDQFQATLTTTGFDVLTNIPSGTVGININVAGPVSGGSMVISIQDVASDDTSQVLGPITTGPTILTAGTYQFTATTRSNAIRVTHTITGVSSFAGTSISVVSHLGGDVDQVASIETGIATTLTNQLELQKQELFRMRRLLEAMLEQMQLQTDIQSKIH